MRASSALVVLGAVLAAACGDGSMCDVRVADGILEPFKDGCVATTSIGDPAKPFRVDLGTYNFKTYPDALNDVYFFFPGSLFVGRRGNCGMSIDTSVDHQEKYGCDFEVKAADALEGGTQRITLDIPKAYLAVFGKYGTFEGTIHVETINSGTSP